jgi:hypothetical protein
VAVGRSGFSRVAYTLCAPNIDIMQESKLQSPDRITESTALPASPAGTPPVKGPLVWLDMDQKDLDDAYDQSVYAPNMEQITGRWATNS